MIELFHKTKQKVTQTMTNSIRTATIYSEMFLYIEDYLESEINFMELADNYIRLQEILLVEFGGIDGGHYSPIQQSLLEELDGLILRRLATIEDKFKEDEFPTVTEEEFKSELLLLYRQNDSKELFS